MWVTFTAGYQLVYQALIVIMVGLIGYAVLIAVRNRPPETNGTTGPSPNGDGRADTGDGHPIGQSAKTKPHAAQTSVAAQPDRRPLLADPGLVALSRSR